jgi:hypothetical protein
MPDDTSDGGSSLGTRAAAGADALERYAAEGDEIAERSSVALVDLLAASYVDAGANAMWQSLASAIDYTRRLILMPEGAEPPAGPPPPTTLAQQLGIRVPEAEARINDQDPTWLVERLDRPLP